MITKEYKLANCLHCGKEFQFNPNKPKIFCCNECYKLHRTRENKPTNPKKIFICVHCGKEFISKKGTKKRTPMYCSLQCYGLEKRMHVYCKGCGKEVPTTGGSKHNRKYCSNKCRNNARKGIPLSTEWRTALSDGRKNSDKCKGENLYNWKGGKENRRFKNKERHYKNKGLSIKLDKNLLVHILKVQNNKCFYCESDLTQYKAIEHLTPIAKGGDNHFANLVYSCKTCNSRKHDKRFEEYAIMINRVDLIEKWEQFILEVMEYKWKK